jgi:hypothetical protein
MYTERVFRSEYIVLVKNTYTHWQALADGACPRVEGDIQFIQFNRLEVGSLARHRFWTAAGAVPAAETLR